MGHIEDVTATEAAALTGLSERTIRRRIARGELPARHIGPNRYAIRVADLPQRRRPSDLEARIEAVEHRLRLLELSYQSLASGGVAGARNGPAYTSGYSAGSDALEPLADTPTALTTAPSAIDPAIVAALRAALSQLTHEAMRLSAPESGAANVSGAAPSRVDERSRGATRLGKSKQTGRRSDARRMPGAAG